MVPASEVWAPVDPVVSPVTVTDPVIPVVHVPAVPGERNRGHVPGSRNGAASDHRLPGVAGSVPGVNVSVPEIALELPFPTETIVGVGQPGAAAPEGDAVSQRLPAAGADPNTELGVVTAGSEEPVSGIDDAAIVPSDVELAIIAEPAPVIGNGAVPTVPALEADAASDGTYTQASVGDTTRARSGFDDGAVNEAVHGPVSASSVSLPGGVAVGGSPFSGQPATVLPPVPAAAPVLQAVSIPEPSLPETIVRAPGQRGDGRGDGKRERD